MEFVVTIFVVVVFGLFAEGMRAFKAQDRLQANIVADEIKRW